MSEKMNQLMVDAATKAGISIIRAKKIYRMRVLGREFYHGDHVDLSLTDTECEWIVDVYKMLSKEGSTWDPKEYHRFEKKKTAMEWVYNSVVSLLAEDDSIIGASADQLYDLAKNLINARIDICGDPELSMDDINELVSHINRAVLLRLDKV
jgi:hypothetical protein